MKIITVKTYVLKNGEKSLVIELIRSITQGMFHPFTYFFISFNFKFVLSYHPQLKPLLKSGEQRFIEISDALFCWNEISWFLPMKVLLHLVTVDRRHLVLCVRSCRPIAHPRHPSHWADMTAPSAGPRSQNHPQISSQQPSQFHQRKLCWGHMLWLSGKSDKWQYYEKMTRLKCTHAVQHSTRNCS